MKASKSKKPLAFQRDRPDLPAEFETGGESGIRWDDGEAITIHEQRLQNVDRPNFKRDEFRIEGCVLERVQLSGGQCATALDWRDVLIQNSEARYAQLPDGKFLNCEFDACDWQEADLQNADLTGCVFRSCNLARADLRGARLLGLQIR